MSPSKWSLTQKLAAFAAVVITLLVIGALVVIYVVAPGMARDLVQSKLDRASERLGLSIEAGSIETTGLDGVEIRDLVVTYPDTGKTLATVELVGASLDTLRLVLGEKVINGVWAEGVDVHVTRQADGEFDVIELARELRKKQAPGGEEQEEGSGGGLLRIFGGEWPDVSASDVEVHVALAEGAPPFPLKRLTIASSELDGDDETVELHTEVGLEAYPSPNWTLPTKATLDAVVSTDLKPQTLELVFDRPVAVSGLEPYPFLQVGFAGFSIQPDRRTVLREPKLAMLTNDGDYKPFVAADAVTAEFEAWSLDPTKIRVLEVQVDGPRMIVDYDPGGASALTDLINVFQAPQAGHVAARARAMASRIAGDAAPKAAADPAADAADADDDAELAAGPPKGFDWITFITERAPQRIVITDAAVLMTDARMLPVVRRAERIELREGNLEISHRPIPGEFKMKGSFKALADGESRGTVKGMLGWQYGSKTIDADFEVDALDLSWAAQLVGPVLSDHVYGGTLRGKFEVNPREAGRAVDFEGLASIDQGAFHWDRIALEPITDFTASYSFAGHYDPDEAMPEPKLLKETLRTEDGAPTQGAFVIEKGQVAINGFTMQVRPALYGTNALPDLPARIDLSVDLPKTDVMKLFNAVPEAIQGDLAGTQMTGSFAWDFELEVPLHHAADMVWEANPVLENFELISMPEAVDVRNLMEGWELTISEPELEFERTVRIPPMRPVPARWLMSTANLTLEEIDARRREREWPAPPEPGRTMLTREEVAQPEVWLTAQAEATAAERPWGDEDTIRRTKEQPYGPYVFTPLPYISRYLTLAITTTEDGSFFTHNGFNFLAIRDSVQDNINAGGYVRGASTISMQLIKNAFLSRDKVLARKIREAFLVWLMESVVDVPKARILEVYFNIIEYGPGIYGIHDAAVHYFGKRPDQLTLAEVAWLVSIIPNPKKYHDYWERGYITDAMFRRMKRYISAMYGRGRISETEMLAASLDAPSFWKPEKDEPVLRPWVPASNVAQYDDLIDEWRAYERREALYGAPMGGAGGVAGDAAGEEAEADGRSLHEKLQDIREFKEKREQGLIPYGGAPAAPQGDQGDQGDQVPPSLMAP